MSTSFEWGRFVWGRAPRRRARKDARSVWRPLGRVSEAVFAQLGANRRSRERMRAVRPRAGGEHIARVAGVCAQSARVRAAST